MKNFLYFTATWCGPCKALGPTMMRVAETVPVTKVDVDQDREKAVQYGIRSVPTVVLMKGEEELERMVGVADYNTYIETYNKY